MCENVLYERLENCVNYIPIRTRQNCRTSLKRPMTALLNYVCRFVFSNLLFWEKQFIKERQSVQWTGCWVIQVAGLQCVRCRQPFGFFVMWGSASNIFSPGWHPPVRTEHSLVNTTDKENCFFSLLCLRTGQLHFHFIYSDRA